VALAGLCFHCDLTPTPQQAQDEEEDEMPTPGMKKKMLAYFSAISTKDNQGGKQKTSGGEMRGGGRGALSLDNLGINTSVQAQLQFVLSLGTAEIALKQLVEANPDVKGGFGEKAVYARDKQRGRHGEDLKRQLKIKKSAEIRISDIEGLRFTLRLLFQPPFLCLC
jgi:hypothetical protein